MRKIGNIFWIVGTNPQKHFDNFLTYINILNVFEEIYIDPICPHKLNINGESVDFGSKSTLNQNLHAWQAMGFIYKISDHTFKKIIPSFTDEELLDIAFYSLFLPTSSEIVAKYRDSILIKLDSLLNPNSSIIDKYSLSKKKGYLTAFDIKKSSGKFENNLLKENKYKSILKTIFKEKENE